MGKLFRGILSFLRGISDFIPLLILLGLLIWFASALEEVMKESRAKRNEFIPRQKAKAK